MENEPASRGASSGPGVEEVLGLIRNGGGRVTSTRRVLLEVLLGSQEHYSAEQLAELVHARLPEVHLSTIYRNLEELQRMGVLVHTHFGHGPAAYQPAVGAHAHFVCEVCATTVEIPPSLVANLAEGAMEHAGFVVDPRHFAIGGRCASCAGTGRSA